MSHVLDYELISATATIVRDLALIQPGERVAITIDTLADPIVAEAVAGQVLAAGAKPLLLRYSTPSGVGKAADPDIPYQAIGYAIGNSDVWLEFGYNWILYSSAQEIALSINDKLRHVCMSGMDTNMMYRLVAGVNFPLLSQFQEKVTAMILSCEISSRNYWKT